MYNSNMNPIFDVKNCNLKYTEYEYNKNLISHINPIILFENIEGYPYKRSQIIIEANIYGTDKIVYSERFQIPLAVVTSLSSTTIISFKRKTFKVYRIFLNKQSKEFLKKFELHISEIICPGNIGAVKQAKLVKQFCEIIHRTLMVNNIIDS